MAHRPCENEQPFTPPLASVAVADGSKTMTIRVHYSVHGGGGRRLAVTSLDWGEFA